MTNKRHINQLLDILSFLREDPDGCSWTKEQTHQSLIPSLLEETYETAEAIDKAKSDDDLRDELGDMLLQIVFHTQIATERGAFTFDDVAQSIVNKLNRRYPTILGDEPNTLKTPEDIDKRWEEVKTEERKAKGQDPATASVLDGVSQALPALIRARKLKARASKIGWEWPDINTLFDKIIEEVEELRAEIIAENINKEQLGNEIGDLMFILVDLASWHNIDAENALRQTNNRFEQRFRHMETGMRKKGKKLMEGTTEERRSLWEEAKSIEKKQKTDTI